MLRRGIFEVILKEEPPDGANALKPRFVVAIKSESGREIMFEARYGIDGHHGKLKHFI